MEQTCLFCSGACPSLVCTSCGAFQTALSGAELDDLIDVLELQMHHGRSADERADARRRKLELSILRCSRLRQRRTPPGAHRLKGG